MDTAKPSESVCLWEMVIVLLNNNMYSNEFVKEASLKYKYECLNHWPFQGTGIHELRHALGMMHEHKNPQSLPYIRTKFVNIKQCKSIIIIIPFPHTKILQQTTFNIFCQKIENLYNSLVNIWLKVENIVAKGEIACFWAISSFVTMFSKSCLLQRRQKASIWGNGVNSSYKWKQRF